MSVMQIVGPTFPLSDIQSSHVKYLLASLCSITFVYCGGVVNLTCYVNYKPWKTSVEDTIAKQGGGSVPKERFTQTLLCGRHRFKVARQVMIEGEHKMYERELHIIQDIDRGGHIVRQAEGTMLSKNSEHVNGYQNHGPLVFVRVEQIKLFGGFGP